jgi:hypothetical protein
LYNAFVKAETTNANLTTTKHELSQVQADLSVTKTKLSNAQKEVQITSANLTATVGKLIQTENSLTNVSTQLETTRQESNSLKSTLNNLQINIERMTTGYGYILKDPTYQEMKSFINSDKTDLKLYDRTNYNCSDFSADVILNAAKQKIRCAYVSIYFAGDTGHAIIAINTTDRGLIYIEPQEDEEVNLQVGKNYYQCVIPKPGYYYTKPSYNDTILKFTIIW